MDQKPTEHAYANDDSEQTQLTQMIIKLRWIGLEDEARRLELEARRLPVEQRCGVSYGPFSTD
jgi:hypothetical protein